MEKMVGERAEILKPCAAGVEFYALYNVLGVLEFYWLHCSRLALKENNKSIKFDNVSHGKRKRKG